MLHSNLERDKSQDYFYGFYRGVVVDNLDPLKAGRVRVRVFPLYDNVPDDELPWAILSDPFMGGLANAGGAFIPNIDAHVFVFFEAGDHMHPVYFGGAPAMVDNTPDLPEESRTNGQYPHNHVFRTTNGIVIEIDNTKDSERVTIKEPSGTTMQLDKNGYTITDPHDTTINTTGDVNITAQGNATVNAQGDATIQASGNVNVTAGGNIVASGTLIQLN